MSEEQFNPYGAITYTYSRFGNFKRNAIAISNLDTERSIPMLSVQTRIDGEAQFISAASKRPFKVGSRAASELRASFRLGEEQGGNPVTLLKQRVSSVGLQQWLTTK